MQTWPAVLKLTSSRLRFLEIAFVCLCAGAAVSGAAPLPVIEQGVGWAECLDPAAESPGGLPAQVVCGVPLYGPTDPFNQANLYQPTRGGYLSCPDFFPAIIAARLALRENGFEEHIESLKRKLSSEQLAEYRARLGLGLDAEAALLAQDRTVNIPEVIQHLSPPPTLLDLIAPALLPGFMQNTHTERLIRFGSSLRIKIGKMSS